MKKFPENISLIAAMSRNRVIGDAGVIPWDIAADRRLFRELTLGHTIIMGRKTYESIGKPLPGRRCIVVSRNPLFSAQGCEIAATLENALSLSAGNGEVFIVGGGELYRQALPMAQCLYLTLVDCDVAGDTTFPALPEGEFVEVRRETVSENPCAELVVYRRTSDLTVQMRH
jgi:dihydrofolate reductase